MFAKLPSFVKPGQVFANTGLFLNTCQLYGVGVKPLFVVVKEKVVEVFNDKGEKLFQVLFADDSSAAGKLATVRCARDRFANSASNSRIRTIER